MKLSFKRLLVLLQITDRLMTEAGIKYTHVHARTRVLILQPLITRSFSFSVAAIITGNPVSMFVSPIIVNLIHHMIVFLFGHFHSDNLIILMVVCQNSSVPTFTHFR